MQQRIGSIALLVRDYDEAIGFYTQQLGFRLLEDTDMGAGKRWVLVAPPGAVDNTPLLLAKAVSEAEISGTGNQAGGRVFLFLHTDNFERDYTQFRNRGVRFLEEPRRESYGSVAVFEDCYGNKWDLLEPRSAKA